MLLSQAIQRTDAARVKLNDGAYVDAFEYARGAAAEFHVEAAPAWREWAFGIAFLIQGRALARSGAYARALPMVDAATESFRNAGDLVGFVHCLIELALYAAAAGDRGEAQRMRQIAELCYSGLAFATVSSLPADGRLADRVLDELGPISAYVSVIERLLAEGTFQDATALLDDWDLDLQRRPLMRSTAWAKAMIAMKRAHIASFTDVSAARSLFFDAQTRFDALEPPERKEAAVCSLELGQVARLSGEFEEAAEKFADARRRFAEASDRHGEARVLLQLGALQLVTGSINEADASLTQASAMFVEVSDAAGHADTLRPRSQIARLTGRLDEATQLLNEALAIYEREDRPLDIAATSVELAQGLRISGHFEPAMELLDRALFKFQGASDLLGIAVVRCERGRVLVALDRYVEAEAEFVAALNNAPDFVDRPTVLEDLGALYLLVGKTEQAKTVLAEAQVIFHDRPDPIGEAQCLLGIAQALAIGGQIDGAEQMANAASALAQTSGNLHAQAVAGLIKADMHYTLGRLDDAAIAYRKAHEAFLRLGADLERAHCLHGMGRSIPDGQEAEQRLSEAAELYRRLGNTSGVADCELALGRRLAAANRWSESAEALRSARATNTRIGRVHNAAHATALLATVVQVSDPILAESLFSEAAAIYHEVGDPMEAACLARRARLMMSRSPGEALDGAMRAVAMIEEARGSLKALFARVEHSLRWESVYETAIRAALDNGRSEQALGAAGLFQGRVLSEEARRSYEPPPTFAAAGTGEQPAGGEGEATEIDYQLGLRANAAAMQAAVDRSGAVLVDLVWRESIKVAFVLRPEKPLALVRFTDDRARAIDGAIAAMKDLAEVPVEEAHEGPWTEPLTTLSDQLWLPIQDLSGGAPVRVMPDADLALVPFAALHGETSGLRLVPGPGLFETRSNTERAGALAVIADARREFPDLDRLCALLEACGARTVDAWSEPAQTLLHDTGSYEALIISSHMWRHTHPDKAAIALATGNAGPRYVTAYELLDLALSAQRVVLAGCVSAAGSGGSEFLSVGATILVGARADAVLATHFPITDVAAFLFTAEVLPAVLEGDEPLETALSVARGRLNLLTPTTMDDHVGKLAQRYPSIDAAALRSRLRRLALDRSLGPADPLLPPRDRLAWTVIGW